MKPVEHSKTDVGDSSATGMVLEPSSTRAAAVVDGPHQVEQSHRRAGQGNEQKVVPAERVIERSLLLIKAMSSGTQCGGKSAPRARREQRAAERPQIAKEQLPAEFGIENRPRRRRRFFCPFWSSRVCCVERAVVSSRRGTQSQSLFLDPQPV